MSNLHKKGEDMKDEMFQQLKDDFKNSSINELKNEWLKIENLGFRGPNVFEYLDFLDDYYISLPTPPEKEIGISEIMTPNFSGSFFFIKLAA